MKAKNALLLVLLALGFGLGAAEITSSQAAAAASGWASGRRLVGRQGRRPASAQSVKPLETKSGKAYAVRLSGGGTVITSGDSERAPIIAFSPRAITSLETNSPLYALVCRDLEVRKAAKGSSASSRWNRLISAGTAASASSDSFSATSEPVNSEVEIDDMRVRPLVSTKWSQSDAYDAEGNEVHCFNYYAPTCMVEILQYDWDDEEYKPVSTSYEHAVCGCVATAMAQVMRYWRYPESAEAFTNACQVQVGAQYYQFSDGTLYPRSTYTQTMEPVSLFTEGGAYDWDNMEDFPRSLIGEEYLGTPVSEAQCQAIGRLTYECGVAAGLSYGLSKWGGTGLAVSKAAAVPAAFRNRFGYRSACISMSQGDLTSKADARARAVLAGLDAGCPSILMINGVSGGHAVVGDGYGFCEGEETPFVHLNLGWSGQNDVWYNLPEVNVSDNPESFSGFSVINDVVYNIFPDAEGGIVSGRVVDEDGNPLAGVSVAVGDYLGNVVTNVTTSEFGVYGVVVPTGVPYMVRAASADGSLVGERDVGAVPEGSNSVLGNSWGNDIVVSEPRVRVGEEVFSGLRAAVDRASVVEGVPTIAILRPLALSERILLDFDCIVTAATDDPADAAVATSGYGGFVVAEGARVLFRNVAIDQGDDATISVQSGGVAAFAGKTPVGTIDLSDADGLEVAGALGGAITVRCKGTSASGAIFGRVTCSQAELGESAAMLVNYYNDEVGGVADFTASPAVVKWGDAPVPPETAVASLRQGGETSYYRSLSLLWADVSGDATVTLFRDCSASGSFAIANDVLVKSDAGAVFSIGCDGLDFTVTGRLRLDSVSFVGGESCAKFIEVNGGTLEMGDGASIEGVKVSAYAPVKVVSGTVSMNSGSRISGCTSTAKAISACASAVYLSGAGCTLRMSGDCEIADCNASKVRAGAVTVMGGATMEVSGNGCRVAGNAAYKKNGNVFLPSVNSTLMVVGSVKGEIGVYCYDSSMDGAGDKFASVTGSADSHAVWETLRSFGNDEDESLYAQSVSGGIAWSTTEPLPATVPQSEAGAKLECGGATEYYATMADAFAVAGTKTATVTLLRDAVLEETLEVPGKITLAGGGHVVTRAAGDVMVVVSAGASLALGDVDFDATAEDAMRLFYVLEGASLTLNSGAVLRNVTGANDRAAGAVAVERGVFTMNSGSYITNCVNYYRNPNNGTGCGGAVLADGSSVYLNGGTVSGCRAYRCGGVYIGNQSKVYIRGDVVVDGNSTLDGEDSNLMVADDRSGLELTAPLTGRIGFYEGWQASTEVFGTVATSFSGTNEELVNSARRFSHDTNGDFGAVGVSGGTRLLVWNDAFEDGVCEDGGVEYQYLSGGDPVAVPDPVVLDGLVYNAAAQEGVAASPHFVLADAVKTNAGAYTATATLREGCTWGDGTTAAKKLSWAIAPAPIVVRAKDAGKRYGCDDPALEYTVTGLIGGDLRSDALEGKIAREAGEALGEYAITRGTLMAVAGGNYDMTFYPGVFTITAELVATPAKAAGRLVYNGKSQTGVEEGEGYTIEDNVAVNAGKYVATAKLVQPGRAWSDGSTEPKEISWEIERKRLVVRADSFTKDVADADPAFTYKIDQNYGFVEGESAETVLEGALTRESGSEPGTYGIWKGSLADTTGNYELVFVNGTLTIEGEAAGETVECTAFTFTAIERQTNGLWRLVLTPGVKYCTYTLYGASELGGEWTKDGGPQTLDADGDFEFSAAASGDRRFWKVVGADGVKPSGD